MRFFRACISCSISSGRSSLNWSVKYFSMSAASVFQKSLGCWNSWSQSTGSSKPSRSIEPEQNRPIGFEFGCVVVFFRSTLTWFRYEADGTGVGDVLAGAAAQDPVEDSDVVAESWPQVLALMSREDKFQCYCHLMICFCFVFSPGRHGGTN